MSTKRKYISLFDQADDEQSYTSELKFNNYKLNWTIKNFEFTCKNVKYLESPRFPATNDSVQWSIRLKPVELKEDSEEDFKISLKNTDGVKRYINVRLTIYNSFQKLCSFFTSSLKHDFKRNWSINGSDFYRKLIRDKSSLPGNILMICELSVFDEGTNILKKPLIIPLQSDNLQSQIESFSLDQSFKDVSFTVEEQKFSAHKTILTLRSPVFAAMFKDKKPDDLMSIVQISDMNSTIFQKMLHFIYTDTVEDLKESGIELFCAAEKYQLEKLKTLCVNSLYQCLSLETVVKTLEFADVFSISKLKDKCLECVNLHLEAVKDTEKFVELIQTRPHLAHEIFEVQKTTFGCENQDFQYSETMAFEFRVERLETKTSD